MDQVINLHISVMGTSLVKVVEFYVAPEHVVLDALFLGFKDVRSMDLLVQLERMLCVLGINGSLLASAEEGNMEVTDMDGNQISTDDLSGTKMM